MLGEGLEKRPKNILISLAKLPLLLVAVALDQQLINQKVLEGEIVHEWAIELEVVEIEAEGAGGRSIVEQVLFVAVPELAVVFVHQTVGLL